ncbi:Flowering-promoting factor 1-like protein 1 [Melia azedarach]|uniref:Flowering-promoting factor 1-like protein 1 n=1 Tax=Melia azedarach TaxID=155640 RepID=A0ACC1YRK4_MELAZ|nr:Flowering-promoting factor 1-like protein 1 [Melia azedarach]
MSGVWIFDKNGVARLIANPTKESFEQKEPPRPGTATAPGARPRVLVYLPANQVIRSYTDLEQRLTELGWSRYYNSHQPNLLQFHKSDDSSHLISLPINFANFRSFHMYDIVVKNRSFFEVRDLNPQNKTDRTLEQNQTIIVALILKSKPVYRFQLGRIMMISIPRVPDRLENLLAREV